MNRLKDKVAIVTGAAGGIGEAIARLFAAEGAKVMATDVQEDKLKAWVQQAGEEKLPIDFAKHDVTSESDWDTVVAKTLSGFGKLDILVNNAGIYPINATTETTNMELWDKVMDINLRGPFIGTQRCLPHLKLSGKGSIVFISSIAGIVGGSGVAYTASKGGVRLLVKDQAVEFAQQGIRVNSIHPGGVLTPMTEFMAATPESQAIIKNICPMGRMGTSLEIAYGALYLASEESSYVTGIELVIDGGLVAR